MYNKNKFHKNKNKENLLQEEDKKKDQYQKPTHHQVHQVVL